MGIETFYLWLDAFQNKFAHKIEDMFSPLTILKYSVSYPLNILLYFKFQ